MYDALFRQLGIIRAKTFEDLLDIPAALSTGRSSRGKRVAILTSTGGAGTIVSDCLGVAGFETPAPDDETAAQLRALQTGSMLALDRNPIDVTLAGLQPDLLRGAIRTLLASPTYDALTIIVGSSAVGSPALMADAIHDCLDMSDKPVIAYVSPYAPEVGAVLTKRGVPAYTSAESCAVALAGLLQAGAQGEAEETSLLEARSTFLTSRRDRSMKRKPRRCFRVSAFQRRQRRSSRRPKRPRRRRANLAAESCSRSSRPRSHIRAISAASRSTCSAENVGERLKAMTAEVASKTGKQPSGFSCRKWSPAASS